MSNTEIELSIIVPVYNEEEVVELFLSEIMKTLNIVDKTYEIIFINDGSKDNTMEKLINLKKTYSKIRIINLSRNFGKESALTAGLDAARGNAIIPIDVDLQDPPELIIDFVKKWEEGYDVVLAKRADRTLDTVSKRVTANIFYTFHNKIADVKIPNNVGDYRLFTRKVLTAIQKLPENQRFMKGIFAWVGFKTAMIEYKRDERKAGKTSFNGWKLWNFALEGITGFSTVLLRIWLYLGLLFASIAMIYGSWIIIKTLIFGIETPGYASTTTIVLFIGGIQLIGMGILGEYVGRLYMESKRRPIYIIDGEY